MFNDLIINLIVYANIYCMLYNVKVKVEGVHYTYFKTASAIKVIALQFRIGFIIFLSGVINKKQFKFKMQMNMN